ncbi:acyl-CoA dehydrogenase [Haloferax mediterranei ATCC 33500]|uniref:Acyl-CoA dehydrogenase n=2 Tax=Haloferacaceae TaxID=1644056 RepID=I3R3W2_HALMT|nr:acyl-CoA dehydrogenase family protein [Haloferax mediterranei]AFK18922.1 putative acyl/butyryl-CoA dehydrogenase [Haloferax mediterranei ATCC 33500]AHZ21715.1 acyl-CoA dehydrogenase [Haloferax mediterranei ATCC 33500]EMA03219.1 putative acyl/butyryl-CoA dehydrogenase [Haloferax mediterranei ATCC 33500]MDX5989015.1 acyl-CoA dehydrogenase family protein [Haloferax mediterranei ATCC 33500]QCQ75408.1 acyl-CoA dehydrogenase [Haloferax mediterranei ATCC 33500]
MDFDLPAEHRMIRDTVREFCEEEIAPIAQDIEDEHRFPAEIFDQLADLDVMGVPIDAEYGGLGGDQLMYALVVEELGRVSGGIGLSYAAHVSLASKPLELFGTEAQKEEWLTPLARGEHMGGWALTEPGSGSDASDMDTIAEKDGDGYVIDGTKQFITNASVAGSVLVKAVTDPGAGYDGISTFIVDPKNDDGFEVTTEWDKMGLNCSPTCELSFDDCWVSEDRLLGEEGEGWEQTKKTLDGGRISIAALSVGLAQGAYEHAKGYAKEREQFGQPISKFDAIRDKLVSMYRKTERARLLTHKAATLYDNGEDVNRESALAKLDASEAAREVSEDAVQVLGGYGYTEDFAPQRFYRDAKLMEIGEGTSEIQHLIIGRQLGL